jgi:precorrin-8X/cobalt-precorrin-8 methylmutase
MRRSGMSIEKTRPSEIERESLSIIRRELCEMGIDVPKEREAVILRVIHATADFEYAENLVFSEDAVPRGIEALLTGAAVVTDTNMAKAGVSKVGLRKLGGEVFCYMAEPAVAERAKEEGTTRAAASVRYAAEMNPGAIFAVGNAPTALLELEAQMERGFRPALVIGVPVKSSDLVPDSLLSTVMMPPGVPVASVGLDAGKNAAIVACQALAIKYPEIGERLVEIFRVSAQKVRDADAKISATYNIHCD